MLVLKVCKRAAYLLYFKGQPGSGKTALAVQIARESQFPFVKMVSLENMVGFNESAKSQAIKKVRRMCFK